MVNIKQGDTVVISSTVTTSVATSWSLIHTWHWLLHLVTDTNLEDADVSGCDDITKGKAHCHGHSLSV